MGQKCCFFFSRDEDDFLPSRKKVEANVILPFQHYLFFCEELPLSLPLTALQGKKDRRSDFVFSFLFSRTCTFDSYVRDTNTLSRAFAFRPRGNGKKREEGGGKKAFCEIETFQTLINFSQQ